MFWLSAYITKPTATPNPDTKPKIINMRCLRLGFMCFLTFELSLDQANRLPMLPQIHPSQTTKNQ
jgi:hypothetical protein